MIPRYKVASSSGVPVPDSKSEYASTSPDSALTEEMFVIPPLPTASAGVHPLAVSLEEGLFAVPQEKVVAQCVKLLRYKYTTMFMYINYGDRIRAHYRDVIYDHFKEHYKEERQDAYHLTMKITALGGEPSPKVGIIPNISDIGQIFITLLQAEKQLIQELRNLSAMAGDNLPLKVMLEQMALTDQQHADDLRRMMFNEGGARGSVP